MLGLYFICAYLFTNVGKFYITFFRNVFSSFAVFFLAMLRIKPRAPYILWIIFFSFHPTKTTDNTLERFIVQ